MNIEHTAPKVPNTAPLIVRPSFAGDGDGELEGWFDIVGADDGWEEDVDAGFEE